MMEALNPRWRGRFAVERGLRDGPSEAECQREVDSFRCELPSLLTGGRPLLAGASKAFVTADRASCGSIQYFSSASEAAWPFVIKEN